MGWNKGFTVMEETVIAAYNSGLRGEELAPLLEPYRGTDIDSGGWRMLKAEDGKGVIEIVSEAFEPQKWADFLAEEMSDDERDDLYWEVFFEITSGRFGWE